MAIKGILFSSLRSYCMGILYTFKLSCDEGVFKELSLLKLLFRLLRQTLHYISHCIHHSWYGASLETFLIRWDCSLAEQTMPTCELLLLLGYPRRFLKCQQTVPNLRRWAQKRWLVRVIHIGVWLWADGRKIKFGNANRLVERFLLLFGLLHRFVTAGR